jgi:hypothetical protein
MGAFFMSKQKLKIYVDRYSVMGYSRPFVPINEEIKQVRRLLDLPEQGGWINFSQTVEFHNCIIILDCTPVYIDFYTDRDITEKVLWCIENNSIIYKPIQPKLERV